MKKTKRQDELNIECPSLLKGNEWNTLYRDTDHFLTVNDTVIIMKEQSVLS